MDTLEQMKYHDAARRIDNGKASLEDIELWLDWEYRCHAAPIVEAIIRQLLSTARWHSARTAAFQKWQKELPEPYRTQCCDIIANGYPRHWVPEMSDEL